MKKLQLSFLLMLTLSLTLFNGCKKHYTYQTFYMDQELKDFAHFKLGSKWVYAMEGSLLKDTVIQILAYIYVGNPKYEDDAEYYIDHFKTSYYADTQIVFSYVSRPTESNTCYARLSSMKYMTDEVETFISNKPIGTTLTLVEYQKITYSDSLPTYTMGAHEFKEVKVFTIDASVRDRTFPQKIFYAKHVGIIRKELYNGEVWNLESYDVAQ